MKVEYSIGSHKAIITKEKNMWAGTLDAVLVKKDSELIMVMRAIKEFVNGIERG